MATGWVCLSVVCLLAVGSDAARSKQKVAAADAPTWKLVKEGAYCSSEVRKNLANVGSVEECQELANSDSECGDQLHTNGELCRCVKVGEDCDFQKSGSGSSVYQHEIKTVDVTWAAASPKWAAAEARCCCNKKKSWKDTLRMKALSGICVVVTGTDTCKGANKVWQIDELNKKVLHTHDDVEDGLCEVPEDHVQDILDDFGPKGCAALDMDEVGFSVKFAEIGATSAVKCPRGLTSTEPDVTCQSNGLFTPTPECHGE